MSTHRLKPGFIIILMAVLFTPHFMWGQTINLKGYWRFHIGDEKSWSGVSFDDKNWEKIMVPSAWEDQGFSGYNGFAWYRTHFDGQKLNQEESYVLRLGYIDDCDEVFLNGKLIGFSGTMPPKFKTAFNKERVYHIPPDALNLKGSNTLAIRVFDVVLAGGIVDGDPGIYRSADEGLLVDLQGLWSFSTCGKETPVTKINEWEVINVPAPWEEHEMRHYDGEAWYKKSFRVPASLKDENLVLLVGRIDDFDRTYLNGKLIGQTRDGMPYGKSRSFQELRVYEIPKGLLRKNDLNIIEIWVEDMGNVGGIYEGPVGIATKTAARRFTER